MIVKFDAAGVKGTKAWEHLIRFFFGGAITAAGLIGEHFGPAIAGLFLAVPDIFPASLALIARQERERKAKKGLHGAERAITAAADCAAGAAIAAWACGHLPQHIGSSSARSRSRFLSQPGRFYGRRPQPPSGLRPSDGIEATSLFRPRAARHNRTIFCDVYPFKAFLVSTINFARSWRAL
jgi:hypothetical protein